MSDSANTPPQPQSPLSEADERALDALLLEALAPARQPRDFTAEILLRLDQQAARRPSRDSAAPPERSGGVVWAATAAIAALAASLLVMLLSGDPALPPGDVAQQHPAVPSPPESAGGAPADVSSPAPGNALAARPQAGESTGPAAATGKPPRRDPVLLSRDRQPELAVAQEQPSIAAPAQPGATDAQVVPPLPESPGGPASFADFNQQFVAYWQSVGVQPAPAIDDQQWQNRIAERFGWQPTEGSEQEVIQRAFAGRDASRALAERLVEQLVVGLEPSAERRQQLVDEATEVILSGGRFDHWLSTWVAEDAGVAPTPPAGTHDPILMGDWFASRIVGADVGCAKCHDSPIDSRYAQDDFWGLAALFLPDTGEPLFYELPDGRQRVATPSVPVRWFGPSEAAASPDAAEALASREELARRMIGSPRVARTLANHLWTIGFGMPLVSATSSPLAPPHDDSLEQALAMLSNRLMSANFDIRAAAQWVIASEPMKRDVPEVLGEQRWQDADEAKLAAASLAQRSFAAAKVTVPRADRSELLAMMQSRSGLIPATLTAPDSLLAQPLLRSPQPPVQGAAPAEILPPAAPPTNQPQIGQGELRDYWWSQWLADREALRGGWLNSIGDTDQQLLHAFYAAGYRDVDREQLERVETLLQATAASEQDRAETIAQIYWILQNSK